jgi:hypothetical protein
VVRVHCKIEICPEEGGSKFLRNVSKLYYVETVLYTEHSKMTVSENPMPCLSSLPYMVIVNEILFDAQLRYVAFKIQNSVVTTVGLL